MARSATLEVVAVGIDRYRPALLGMLSPSERARLERFRRPVDAARSALGMALLRVVAGGHGDVDPQRVEVVRRCPCCGEAHGKPRIDDGWYYSVAHAGDLVVVASTDLAEFGIDLEPADRRVVTVSSSSPSPSPSPSSLPSGLGDLRSWVRREAVVKAIGDGRAVEDGDPIVDDVDGTPVLVHASGIDQASITIVDLDVGPAYIAALAICSSDTFDVIQHATHPLLDHWATATNPDTGH